MKILLSVFCQTTLSRRGSCHKYPKP